MADVLDRPAAPFEIAAAPTPPQRDVTLKIDADLLDWIATRGEDAGQEAGDQRPVAVLHGHGRGHRPASSILTPGSRAKCRSRTWRLKVRKAGGLQDRPAVVAAIHRPTVASLNPAFPG